MRVWIESPFDNLPQEGFRKQRFWLMAEAFARRGHEVVYWTGDFNHIGKTRRRTVAPEAGGEIDLRIFPVMPYFRNVSVRRVISHRAYARDWLRLARQEGSVRKPDLIIASCPTISAAETAVKLAREFGAKSAIDIMDAWPETFERLAPSVLRPLARIFLSGLKRRVQKVYREADVVSGVSERYRQLCRRDDFHLAYHGMEMIANPVVRRYEPGAPVKLAYVGNLGCGYDLGTVIKGVKLLRGRGVDVTLDIAGNGPLEAKWRKAASSGVRFHGYMRSDKLSGLLSGCDFGVIPLRDDTWVGLPYKLGDYIATGLRVLTSLDGECRELVERHRAGAWYPPGDAQGFADAVLSVLPEKDYECGVSALARKLDAKRIYDEYVSIFDIRY